MKKILLLCVLLLSGNVFALAKYDPVCKVSGFDNSKICSVKSYGVFVYDKPTVLSSVSIGGIWTSANPENIAITIDLGDISATIDSISFNLNGKISTFQVPLGESRATFQGGRLWKTSAMVVVPVEFVEQLINDQTAKYRVSTVSNGYREGAFYSSKGETEPVKTLRLLIEKSKIKQIDSKVVSKD
ncbi:hypothetical protein [Acinetobacter populi]|uniref:Uncharacterized protein n=1 Tax=Acinetobacter populi TaxID=1582270 RepID=A0A1Z9Z3J8_9GAMM|nr:hypothetical protein [Acinetobacter populi]OUY09034.1 hypothetical protein CAP51_05385 [Acinetobacter populi]